MPKKPATTHLGVRVTDADRRTLVRAARLCRVPLSVYVRRVSVSASKRLIESDKQLRSIDAAARNASQEGTP